MINYKELPELGVPLIFHGVSGTELREGDNPSFYNPEEISVIENYVTQLLTVCADDLGLFFCFWYNYLYMSGLRLTYGEEKCWN